MDVSVLVCKLRNGSLVSVPEISVVPNLERAKQIRLTGMLDGQSVERGIVLNSDRPVRTFICGKEEMNSAVESVRKAGRPKKGL